MTDAAAVRTVVPKLSIRTKLKGVTLIYAIDLRKVASELTGKANLNALFGWCQKQGVGLDGVSLGLRPRGQQATVWIDGLQNIHRSGLENNLLQQHNLTFSDFFVTNASFFRMDHITVGYSFDKLIGKFTRFYATVQNPFLITKYKGMDPEIGNGIDNNVYPRTMTFLAGVSVDF